jgi:hypothetical protein
MMVYGSADRSEGNSLCSQTIGKQLSLTPQALTSYARLRERKRVVPNLELAGDMP